MTKIDPADHLLGLRKAFRHRSADVSRADRPHASLIADAYFGVEKVYPGTTIRLLAHGNRSNSSGSKPSAKARRQLQSRPIDVLLNRTPSCGIERKLYQAEIGSNFTKIVSVLVVIAGKNLEERFLQMKMRIDIKLRHRLVFGNDCEFAFAGGKGVFAYRREAGEKLPASYLVVHSLDQLGHQNASQAIDVCNAQTMRDERIAFADFRDDVRRLSEQILRGLVQLVAFWRRPDWARLAVQEGLNRARIRPFCGACS